MSKEHDRLLADDEIAWANKRLPLAKWLYRFKEWDKPNRWKSLSDNEQRSYCLLADEVTLMSASIVRKEIVKERDTWWHDKIQEVKRLIGEGKNPINERDENTVHDNWHPELALLWEIAIEALQQGKIPKE